MGWGRGRIAIQLAFVKRVSGGSPINLDGIPTVRSANHARAGNSALSRKTAIVQSLLRRVRTEADALGIRPAEASADVSSDPPGSRV